MSATQSSRLADKAPQLALRFGTPPVGTANWRDGSRIAYLGCDFIVRLGTHLGVAEVAGNELHLPLPPEARPRQIQDSAESWLRQRCVEYVENEMTLTHDRQLVQVKQGQKPKTTGDKAVAQERALHVFDSASRGGSSAPSRVATRCPIRVQLSFATRSPWLAVEDQDTLRCNWRLIELAPAVIEQHIEKALGQLAALRDANTTTDMFGALPA